MPYPFLALGASSLRATVLTSIPGPDDQGGMIMPMVMLSGTTLSLMFNPTKVPKLASLTTWSPGNTFEPTAAWYSALDPVGGAGDLFNNQYGFTFMSMDGLPEGKALAISLASASSIDLEFYNYVNSQNRFDRIFSDTGYQVLWSGDMWHNYVTLPSNAAAGTYTASFEVYVVDGTFSDSTGYADYTSLAQNAPRDMDYNSVTINYTWTVVPEPSTGCSSASPVCSSWCCAGSVRSPSEAIVSSFCQSAALMRRWPRQGIYPGGNPRDCRHHRGALCHGHGDGPEFHHESPGCAVPFPHA